jgi:predicted XRE-type DNA-binding protein
MSNAKDELDLVRGSGNVFKDHGETDADVQQMKGILASRIIELLEERELSVRAAERTTGIAAADFSRIRNADLGRFSLDRLVRIVNRLDADTEVSVQLMPRRPVDAAGGRR